MPEDYENGNKEGEVNVDNADFREPNTKADRAPNTGADREPNTGADREPNTLTVYEVDVVEPAVYIEDADFGRTIKVEREPGGEEPRTLHPSALAANVPPAPSVAVSNANFSVPSPPAYPAQMEATDIRGSHAKDLVGLAIKGEYIYAILGLVLGLSSIIGGIILGLHGVAGSTSWTASFLGAQSQINDAAPGVVLFVVGLFMVWVTKPKVGLNNIRG